MKLAYLQVNRAAGSATDCISSSFSSSACSSYSCWFTGETRKKRKPNVISVMISPCWYGGRDLKLRMLQSRCNGGSLPLKKRRISVFSDDYPLAVPSVVSRETFSSTVVERDTTRSPEVKSSQVQQQPLVTDYQIRLFGSDSSPRRSPSFQDRRYTGSPGEVRCKATTTRGRECAYIAIGGKYCNLHADYDNNPPPRRGRPSSSKPTKSLPTKLKLATVTVSDGGSLDLTHSLSSESSVSGTSTITTESLPPKSKSHDGDTKSKINTKGPGTLLNMIATDQWLNKRVKITSGPLAERVGTVERWSNGWVSVRVDGTILHNRRSFELLVVQEESVMTGNDSKNHENASLGVCALVATGDPSCSESNGIKMKVPVSPYAVKEIGMEWPITTPSTVSPDSPSVGTPFVPNITPNSPRKAVSTSHTDNMSVSDGILLYPDRSPPPLKRRHNCLGGVDVVTFAAPGDGETK